MRRSPVTISLAAVVATALAALAVAGCPGGSSTKPPHNGGDGAGTGTGSQSGPSTPAPDGASCLAAADCASGVCEGEGCTDDRPGTCVPASRACTKDLRPYCGCDGQTFRTSGSCPGQRFAFRGECGEGQAAP